MHLQLMVTFIFGFSVVVAVEDKEDECDAKLDRVMKDLRTLREQMKEMISNDACTGSPAGIEDSTIIDDKQLMASSNWLYGYYKPQSARLRSTTGLYDGRKIGWLMLPPYRVGAWLQVDLKKNRRVFGVATQGAYGEDSYYVRTYKLAYRKDGQGGFKTFTDEKGNVKVFKGNVEGHESIVKNNFDEAVTARFIRITPLSWWIYPFLRWEVYVC